MKVGYISSWAECCGVSEYAKNLVNGMVSYGNDIKVTANYPKAQLWTDEDFVTRCFHCPFMTNQLTADIDLMVDMLSDRDIVHCQFETSLYNLPWFSEVLTQIRNLGIPVVFTMHSSGMWPSFNLPLVNHFITHTKMWCSNTVMPIPVQFWGNPEPENYNSIISFGLGRNRDDLIKEAIKGTDLTFTTSYGHQIWLPLEDLVATIQKHWIISLIYPDIGTTEVSSSAIALAFGLHRPVLISSSNWFRNDKEYPGVYVCHDVKDTCEIIKYLSENPEEIKDDIDERRLQIITKGRSNTEFFEKHHCLYNKLINS